MRLSKTAIANKLLSERPGESHIGRESRSTILEATHALIVDEGFAGLSMRKLAERAGMSLGRVRYHYKSKEELFNDLLDYVISIYQDTFSEISIDENKSDEEKFQMLIHLLFNDLGRKETTNFFPELWVLANHDKQGAAAMENFYAKFREKLCSLISLINPRLTKDQNARAAIFISATVEGHTMFVGHGRSFATERNALARIAVHQFLALVRDDEFWAETD